MSIHTFYSIITPLTSYIPKFFPVDSDLFTRIAIIVMLMYCLENGIFFEKLADKNEKKIEKEKKGGQHKNRQLPQLSYPLDFWMPHFGKLSSMGDEVGSRWPGGVTYPTYLLSQMILNLMFNRFEVFKFSIYFHLFSFIFIYFHLFSFIFIYFHFLLFLFYLFLFILLFDLFAFDYSQYVQFYLSFILFFLFNFQFQSF
jgi:hypothetical protein